MARTILVTGGAGFIGSSTSEALLERGDRVVCLDNLDPYYDPAIKREHIQALEAHPGFHFQLGDIRDEGVLGMLGDHFDFDAILHLAARAGVRPSIEEPALYSDVNIAGTTNLLEMARQRDIRNFVFASSSSVYGERKEYPFRETDSVDHPVSPYAASKKAGELLSYSYHHLYGLDVSCLRFFTVYGPRQRPEMAIHKFTRTIREGRPIPMFGDGSARRDYTFIDDIVQGVIAAIDRNEGYEIYNLGNKRMVSLAELIELIATALGQEAVIDRLPAQPGDVSITCADISHAGERLGYTPATPIESGIEQFVDWYLSVKV